MADKLIALVARHGEVQANKKPIFRGRVDEDLEPEGLDEAKDAATKLKKLVPGVKRIVSSPLNRALETAKCYAKEYGLEVEQDGALMSFDTGIFTGLDKDLCEEAYQLFLDNSDVAIPNGESVNHIHERVGKFFKGEFPKSEKELTLYIAHSSTAVCLHNLILGKFDLNPGTDEVVAPGGVVGVYADGDGYKIKTLVEEEEPAPHGS
jgi:probable phosphoglycerate mutase